jgi:RNA polymerase sigma-70 factor, ECF subfamily
MSGSSSTPQFEDRLADLMVAYQGGDPAAFERLYELLVADVRRYFARVHRDRGSVHDLVQDTFLEMHRSRRTYNAPLPVRPWVLGIARNVSARSLRAAHVRPQAQSTLDAEVELRIAAPSSDLPAALDIENAVATLPPSTREPWLLHHVFGFSFDSIATRLGITSMAAKLRSSRATRALRVALSGKRKDDHE